jgi:hypothetical protein
MTMNKSDFLLNFMMFCLGATVGRRIDDPYLMRRLAAKSADLMLVNLPHWRIFERVGGTTFLTERVGAPSYFWPTTHNGVDPGLKMREHLCLRYCNFFDPFYNLNCSAWEHAPSVPWRKVTEKSHLFHSKRRSGPDQESNLVHLRGKQRH